MVLVAILCHSFTSIPPHWHMAPDITLFQISLPIHTVHIRDTTIPAVSSSIASSSSYLVFTIFRQARANIPSFYLNMPTTIVHPFSFFFFLFNQYHFLPVPRARYGVIPKQNWGISKKNATLSNWCFYRWEWVITEHKYVFNAFPLSCVMACACCMGGPFRSDVKCV